MHAAANVIDLAEYRRRRQAPAAAISAAAPGFVWVPVAMIVWWVPVPAAFETSLAQ